MIVITTPPIFAKDKGGIDYGTGLIVNLPLPEGEVLQVVKDVVRNGIIRGTKEYNKDDYIAGAETADSSKAFPSWTDGGTVFYKVRRQALDPRNFKDSGDVGTLTVRYVVQPQGERNTILRIDAIFVEDYRHAAHASNGSVEGSEYKNIQDRLDEIELMKKQAAEAELDRQTRIAKKNFELAANGTTDSKLALDPPGTADGPPKVDPATPLASVADLVKEDAAPAIGPRPGESVEEYANELRHKVEKRVKFPGAPLKSAPFHSATTMASLPTGSEILVVITTQYWFGIETRQGQHGWLPRDEVEELQ